MANTTYTIPMSRLTGALRKTGLQQFANMLAHLDAYNIDLVSVGRQGANVNIVLSDPVPADQLEHIGLV